MPASTAALEHAAWQACTAYLETHRAALGIELAELGTSRVTAAAGEA